MSADKGMKIILVGCGAVAERLYAPCLRHLVDDGVLGDMVLIDRSEKQIEKVHRILPNASVRVHLSEVDTELDGSLVIVALPHNLHARATITALQAGAHVLCEKPMARTVEECDAMLTTETASARLLAIGHFRRFFPAVNVIRDWIAEERLGKLISFRFLEGEVYSWPAASASFFSREAAGGGVLIDAGAHTMDLLLWWMGSVEELVYSDDASGGVEANCILKLKMQSGVVGFVQMSRDWPLANQYYFEFERGWLLYTCDIVDSFRWGWSGNHLAYHVVIEDDLGVGFDRLPKSVRSGCTMMRCFERQLSNVLAAIQGKQRLVCPGTEGRKAVGLIERCYRERQVLRQAWLPKNEQAKLETFRNDEVRP
jgi:predicted dehydrogenase